MPCHYLTLCLFRWKIFCKNRFPHFLAFGSTKKKIGQRKTIFSQLKTLTKIRLIFYRLFSKFFFWKTISLSLVVSLINIIFFCNCGKYNFLVPSLSLTVSSLTFSLITYFFYLNFKLDFFFSVRNFQFDGF